jgi:predicted O-linked N-acetylglucosamine transferase (SPINDLY family)
MNPSEIQKLLVLAEKLLHSDNFSASENLLKTILKKNENNYRANELLGYCYIQKNILDEGLRHLLLAAKNPKATSQLFYEIGSTYLSSGNFVQAEFFLDKAQKISPNSFEILHDLAASQASLGRLDKAVKNFELAGQINKSSHELYFNIGKIYHDLNNFSKAVEFYSASLAIHPRFLNSLINKGLALQELKNYQEALIVLSEAYKIKGDDLYLPGLIAHLKMLICDWDGVDSLVRRINLGLDNGKKVVEPFGFQGISSSESDLLNCARIYGNDLFPSSPQFVFDNRKSIKNKIRIGYLSGEFRDHATSHLICELLELHNKDKFEIYGFDNGFDDKSLYRERVLRAFDKFFLINPLSDSEAANLVFSNEIDILVNLNGYFGKGRQGIFAQRPSPIQINFLGFPGTLGVDYLDYIICDSITIPLTSQNFYSEKCIYLPNSYQCNDTKRVISDEIFSRSDFGLPHDAFVFCCFNNNYKITFDRFSMWTRILNSVPRSVLWLFKDNEHAKSNLLKEATKLGLDTNRIIFAERLPSSSHLARHRLADLFLDTLPYNAHTTASDALWSGLPLLTQCGNTFPGRVAASLLNAAGLPELITYSDEEYIDKAIRFALNPTELKLINQRLDVIRESSQLFNSKKYTKDLEHAYEITYDRFIRDEKITNITI